MRSATVAAGFHEGNAALVEEGGVEEVHGGDVLAAADLIGGDKFEMTILNSDC